MVSPLDRTGFSDWEHEGELVASDLDTCACALVLGPDAIASAEAALGIARIQARRRRVAVGDVVGELAPIEALLPTESPYGMMDSFLYGVSIAKIAHAVDPARNLFVMPSGVGPIDHEAILRSDRWTSLIAGFREAGALLLVVAPAGEDALAALTASIDGVVLLADADPPPGTRVLAHIQPGMPAEHLAAETAPAADAEPPLNAPPSSSTPVPAATVAAALTPSPAGAAPADHTAGSRLAPAPAPAPTATPPAPMPSSPYLKPSAPDAAGLASPLVTPSTGRTLDPLLPRLHDSSLNDTLDDTLDATRNDTPEPSIREVLGDHLGDAALAHDATAPEDALSLSSLLTRMKPIWVAIAAAVIASIAILTWALQRGETPARTVAQDSSASAPASAAAPSAPTSAPRATTAAVAAGDIANPAAANQAARYAVALAQVYNITDANAWLEKDGVRDLPATTFTDRADGSRTAYLVLAGAFQARSEADSLLRALRRRGVLRPGQGHIEAAPVALMLFGDIPADQAGYTIRGYRSKGIPIYSLSQQDGTVSLYVGAYPSATAAQDMLATLRRGGDQPKVVYRIGSAR